MSLFLLENKTVGEHQSDNESAIKGETSMTRKSLVAWENSYCDKTCEVENDRNGYVSRTEE
jgi:hypothetical protein